MLTAEQRETIRQARDAVARDRAKRTRAVENQLERELGLRGGDDEVTDEAPQSNGATIFWSREAIIRAMLRWRDEHGSLPTSSQWQRRHDGFPTYPEVRKVFDGWAEAIAAAEARIISVDLDSPEDEPEPEPQPEPAAENPSFAELAEHLEASHLAVEEAEAHYEAALERFRAHPLFKQAA